MQGVPWLHQSAQHGSSRGSSATRLAAVAESPGRDACTPTTQGIAVLPAPHGHGAALVVIAEVPHHARPPWAASDSARKRQLASSRASAR